MNMLNLAALYRVTCFIEFKLPWFSEFEAYGILVESLVKVLFIQYAETSSILQENFRMVTAFHPAAREKS